jgi:hypothetical protein
VSLLGITAIALIPGGILEFIAVFYLGDIQSLENIFNSFFSNFATLALIVAISNIDLGRDFSIKSSYSEGLKRFWSVFGAGILIGLAIVLPIVVVAFCVITVIPDGFVVLVFAIPPAIFLSTRWSLSSQVIVLENVGASDGLKRSWELTKDFFWRVLGTSFAAGLLAVLLSVLPNLFTIYILNSLGFSFRIVELAGLVVEKFSLIIVMPFTIAVQVLIYYDLRIRKEGFDLLLRAEGGLENDQAAF